MSLQSKKEERKSFKDIILLKVNEKLIKNRSSLECFRFGVFVGLSIMLVFFLIIVTIIGMQYS